jgi:hypothetical protein
MQPPRSAARVVGMILLYLKSRYITTEYPGYERQKNFDDALAKLGLFDFSEYGPPAEDFQSTLSRAGYTISGFELGSRPSSQDVKRLGCSDT